MFRLHFLVYLSLLVMKTFVILGVFHSQVLSDIQIQHFQVVYLDIIGTGYTLGVSSLGIGANLHQTR